MILVCRFSISEYECGFGGLIVLLIVDVIVCGVYLGLFVVCKWVVFGVIDGIDVVIVIYLD